MALIQQQQHQLSKDLTFDPQSEATDDRCSTVDLANDADVDDPEPDNNDDDDCHETTEQLLAQLWQMAGRTSYYCLSCPCNISKDDFLSMMTYEASAQLNRHFYTPHKAPAATMQDYMTMNSSTAAAAMMESRTTLPHQKSSFDVPNNDDDGGEFIDLMRHHPHCRFHLFNLGDDGGDSKTELPQLTDWLMLEPYSPPYPDISVASSDLIRSCFDELKSLQLIHRIGEAHTRTKLVFNDLPALGAVNKPNLLHQSVELNIFLPNGFFVKLSTYNDITLAEIKDDLWSMLADTRQGKVRKRKFWFHSLRLKRLKRTLSFRHSFNKQNTVDPRQRSPSPEAEKIPEDPTIVAASQAQPLAKQFDHGDTANNNELPPMKLLMFVDDAKQDYSFRSVTKPDEIYDDNCRLFELTEQVPYYLRLVEFTSDKQEKLLNMQIRQIIKRPVNELETEKYRTDEFLDYRYGLYECMRRTVEKREHWIQESADNRLMYEFPPELDEIETLELSVRNLQRFWLDDANEDGEINTQNVAKTTTTLLEHLAKAFDKPFLSDMNGGDSIRRRKQKLPGCYSPKFHPDERRPPASKQLHEDDQSSQYPLYTEVYAYTNVGKTPPPITPPVTVAVPPYVDENPPSSTVVSGPTDRWYEPDVILKRYLQRKKSSKKHKLHLRRAKHQPTLQPVIEDEELKTSRIAKPPVSSVEAADKTENITAEQEVDETILRYSKTAEFRKPYPKKWPISVWARPDDLIRVEPSLIAKKKVSTDSTKLEVDVNKLECNQFGDITADGGGGGGGDSKPNERDTADNGDSKPSAQKNNRKLLKRWFSFRSQQQPSTSKTNDSDDQLSHSSSSDSEVASQLRSTQSTTDKDRCIEFVVNAHSHKTPGALIEKVLKTMANSFMVDSNSQLLAGMKNWFINKKLKHFSEHLINSIGFATTTSPGGGQMANNNSVRYGQTNLDPNAYLLKICGMEQYLIQDHPIIRYEFIRSRISKGKRPNLRLVHKDWVMAQLPVGDYIPVRPSFLDRLQHNISYAEKSFSYNLVSGYNSEPGRQLSRSRGQATKPREPPEIILPDSSTDYCQYSTISHVMVNGGGSASDSASSNQPDVATTESDFYSHFIVDSKALDNWKYVGIHREEKLISLWRIGSAFRLRVLVATYVSVKDFENVFVQAAIFHGREQLGQTCRTRDVGKKDLQWNETFEFNDVSIQTLTLSCRLSISLCAINRKQHEEYPIARASLPLFNYRHCLLSGRTTVALCPVPKDAVDWFSEPVGSHTDFQTCPRLELIFDSFYSPPVYPSHVDIIECAKEINRKEAATRQQLQQMLPQLAENGYIKINGTVFDPCSISRMVRTDSSRSMVHQLRKALSKRDPFTEMSEQEKNFFWRERFVIKDVAPDALPKVVDSVRWTNRNEVCQLYALLDGWPMVSVDVAIMLLGPRYLDPFVRSYAIRCLDAGLTDGLMVDYLLQLVQLLRWEVYLNNDLVQMLLRRSLLNRRLGNRFFWHVRSQLDDPYFGPRWCVLLEMYCRGLTGCDIRNTHRQVLALEEIERIGQDTIGETADRKLAILKHLQNAKVMDLLDRFNNPLDISLKLAELKTDSLRVMDSAKRPLWLEWFNADLLAAANRLETSAIIFKSGDDLRQDMLTLQVIRIMDQIWRRENLDLRMLPYHCLATGDQVGLIEVVRHAKTVMGIQRVGGRKAALQIDSSKLHKWIRDHNADNYDNAVDNFTRSCAGYCVATFILGIGDRNPDNIMVNEDGQIFHIDFGHFLGHFKKKFGINRERVPFVLTYDFLQVITKGSENPLKSKEFEAFQNLCNDAYLALHDNACLLISLFTMMLGRGIPELQTIDDIQYLRRTLQVDAKSRQEALQYFEQQLDEAHGGAWSTKLDWFFHSVKHA